MIINSLALVKTVSILIFSARSSFMLIGVLCIDNKNLSNHDFIGLSMMIIDVIFFVTSFIGLVFLILFFYLKKAPLLVC